MASLLSPNFFEAITPNLVNVLQAQSVTLQTYYVLSNLITGTLCAIWAQHQSVSRWLKMLDENQKIQVSFSRRRLLGQINMKGWAFLPHCVI